VQYLRVLLLVLLAGEAAQAGYPYSAGKSYGHATYPAATVHYPVYSDWTYHRQANGHFRRSRWGWNSAYDKFVDHDPAAYEILADGRYRLVGHTQIGDTVYGGDAVRAKIAKVFPELAILIPPATLRQAGLADPTDVQSLLPPAQAFDDAALNSASRSLTLMADSFRGVADKRLDNQRFETKVRGEVAKMAQSGQNFERAVSQFKELYAVVDQQARISESGDGGGFDQVEIPKVGKQLSAVINAKCVSCHGPTKAEKGLDFTKPDQIGYQTLGIAYAKVYSGEMPPGSKAKLSEAETDLFLDASLELRSLGK